MKYDEKNEDFRVHNSKLATYCEFIQKRFGLINKKPNSHQVIDDFIDQYCDIKKKPTMKVAKPKTQSNKPNIKYAVQPSYRENVSFED